MCFISALEDVTFLCYDQYSKFELLEVNAFLKKFQENI